ncbi:MAG: hypothetical protein GY931_09070 [Maribacter sp.]|nr:hypothetical protein [Maribacter sp.]
MKSGSENLKPIRDGYIMTTSPLRMPSPVIEPPLGAGKIDDDTISKLMSWKHSGYDDLPEYEESSIIAN